jgi:four helix bundle protein
LPREERFGLASQIRRAAVSVPANIAEVQARFSSREFARIVAISYGSLAELETHIELVRRLGYASEADLSSVDRLLGSVGGLLNGLAKSLKARPM